jgi:hypothetical protein
LSKHLTSDEDYRSSSLLEKPYESLAAYAKVVRTATNEEPLETVLASIDESTVVRSKLLEYEWARKLLFVSLAAKFQATTAGRTALRRIKRLKSTASKPIESPVVIVAGGCNSEVEDQMRAYRGLILEAFRVFKGTIISGGTTSGVSGLVGEAQQKYRSTVRAIGYVPKAKIDLLDKRYSEIRFTEGKDFSPDEPLQYWIDIVTSGIKSSDVKLLGINGGRISAFEYRMALALGASVAIVKGSGMEADKLFLDADWNKSRNLVSVANDPVAVEAFLRA